MIDLMTENTGKQFFGIVGTLITIEVGSFHYDMKRPSDFFIDVGNGEAGFFHDVGSFPVEDPRIQKNDQFALFLADRKIDGDQTDALIDLRRGQADTRRGMHGGHHGVGQVHDIVINILNLFGFLMQDGTSIYHYLHATRFIQHFNLHSYSKSIADPSKDA